MIARCFALVLLATPAAASEWAVDQSASHLGFTATQSGVAFSGEFRTFETTIDFDPASPGAARIRVTVDLASVNAGAKDRTEALATPPWFDIAHHPTAIFKADGMTPTGAHAYRADGTLEIKGIERPASLTFTLVLDGGKAHAVGGLALNRLDYQVGSGEFSTDRYVGLDVKVSFDLIAMRKESPE